MDVPRGFPDAILRPRRAEQAIRVERMPVGRGLAGLADYHWYVGWRTVEPHEQPVVPQPRVHLAAELYDGVPRLVVQGIRRELFRRTLVGEGHVLGVAFHPGGFRPFLGRAVGTICDSEAPAADLLGADDRAAAARVLETHDPVDMVAAVEEYLLALDPPADPVVAEIRSLVAEAERQRGMTRADELASYASMSLRSLQRLFTEYVGIGPKWVVARCRILDAAAAAHRGDPVDWAAVATELGFADQAHLTRAFTAVVGTPPASYSREA